MKQNQAWTLETLETAVKGLAVLDDNADIHCKSANGVLEVFVGANEATLFMKVGSHQILTSTILWARDEQDDPEEFEAMMLRNHKNLLPLCAVSIATIDGREYYELFGAMSVSSTIESVITELRSIAGSAIELATDIGPARAA